MGSASSIVYEPDKPGLPTGFGEPTPGMLLAVVGVAFGLIGALGLTRLITAMLFGVSATNGHNYAGVSVLLVATVFVACIVPARRAAAVDPLEALRAK